MNYTETDQNATIRAKIHIKDCRYFPFWDSPHKMKIEPVALCGQHYRTMTGEVIPEAQTFATKEEAVKYMLQDRIRRGWNL